MATTKEELVSERPPDRRMTRRTLLKTAAAGAAGGGFPWPLRAQPRAIKVAAIHCVTGPLAEPGQACRLAAQIAADAINQAGGIKSMGGARFELLLGDTQTKQDVARAEAERLINAGAQVLVGTFNSADTAAIVPVAQQRRIPFLIDISAADPITANVAKSVKDGQQKVQYVYRNFPTGTLFGQRAVQYFNEIFKEAAVSPKRVVVMHANDLFGQNQARGFQAAHKAAAPAWEIVEVIPWPEPPSDLSTEVSRAKAAKPDIIAPITRPASAQLLLPELTRQRVELMGVMSPGSPGLYEAGQIAVLKEQIEYVMVSVPWPNFQNPRARHLGEEYAKRSGGKTLDTNSGYTYDALFILADVFERAKTTEPDAVVEAIRKTNFKDNLMVSTGPVVFNEIGDNPNAAPAMVQILGQKPVVVWPRDLAAQKFVFPRPRA
jgi:branched-chain amino acid transport system substrate-binding protein